MRASRALASCVPHAVSVRACGADSYSVTVRDVIASSAAIFSFSVSGLLILFPRVPLVRVVRSFRLRPLWGRDDVEAEATDSGAAQYKLMDAQARRSGTES